MHFNKYITIIVQVCIIVCIYHGNTSHGNDKTPGLSTSSGMLMQVNLQYYNDFFYADIWKHNNPEECFTTFRISTFMVPYFIPVLRCREQLFLLRPEKTIRAWQQMQKQQGYILLNMPEYGLNNLHAYISSVDNLHLYNTIRKNHPDTGQITGIFLHHTKDVRQYIIQNKETGKTSYINATPSHKFYMENKKVFVPISQFTDKDTLLDYHGKRATLLCGNNKHSNNRHGNNRHKHCGKPIYQGKPTTVYNLEVYPQHTYYIGEPQILAHNCCIPDRKYTKLKRMMPMTGIDEIKDWEKIESFSKSRHTKFYNFFTQDLDKIPFHVGYNKPNAWQFGNNRKLSHVFLYRKLDNNILFLEYLQTRNHPSLVLFSSLPEDIFNAKNYEFATKPAKTFSSYMGSTEQGFRNIVEEIISFKSSPHNYLTHNCQHFCQHVEDILTRSPMTPHDSTPSDLFSSP